MKRRIVSFVGSAVFLTVGAGSGCTSTSGSDDSGTTDGGSDSAKDSGMMMQTLGCTDYCSTFAANCGATPYKYADSATCMAVCMALPLGSGPIGMDTSMQTIACRQYHAGAAATNPTLHCPHAAAWGGGGTCGPSDCDSFCTILGKICPGAMNPWTGTIACTMGCPNLSTMGTVGASSGNTPCTGPAM